MTALPSPWRRVTESRAITLVLLAVFVGLVVTTITRFSLWIDESATLELVATRGYAGIVRAVRFDAHPPLWYLVLKPWLQIFGAQVVAARAQSAVFMIAAFAVWHYFVRTRFSRPLAVLVLALMVTNPMLLHYAVEGRMYAFGILLTAISCVLLTSTWRRHWYAYWLCAVLMLYTHYFLLFVVAAQFLYLMLRRRELALSVRWILVYGASIVVAFLPWLPNAFHIASSAVSSGMWIGPVSPNTLVAYVWSTFVHRLDGELLGARVFPALLYLVTWIYVVVRAARARVSLHALLFLMLGVPWLALFLLSCWPFVPVFHPRYVIFGLPGLITLMGAGALLLRGRWRAVAIAILLLGQLTGLQNLRWRGFTDSRDYYVMDKIAADVSQTIDGEKPDVVATWLFTFFDAKAALGDDQRVVFLRDSEPHKNSMPDVIYFDRRDWYIRSLDEIHAKYAWTIEDGGINPIVVPDRWHLVVSHKRGYARYRLFSIDPPGAAAVASPPVSPK